MVFPKNKEFCLSNLLTCLSEIVIFGLLKPEQPKLIKSKTTK